MVVVMVVVMVGGGGWGLVVVLVGGGERWGLGGWWYEVVMADGGMICWCENGDGKGFLGGWLSIRVSYKRDCGYQSAVSDGKGYVLEYCIQGLPAAHTQNSIELSQEVVCHCVSASTLVCESATSYNYMFYSTQSPSNLHTISPPPCQRMQKAKSPQSLTASSFDPDPHAKHRYTPIAHRAPPLHHPASACKKPSLHPRPYPPDSPPRQQTTPPPPLPPPPPYL